MTDPDPDTLEQYIGKWVTVTGKDRPWILAKYGIDPKDINRLENDLSIHLAEVIHPAGNVPLDLLWYGDEYIAVPRGNWQPRDFSIEGIHD